MPGKDVQDTGEANSLSEYRHGFRGKSRQVEGT